MGPKDELHVLMGRLDAQPEVRTRRGTYRQKRNTCYSFLGERLVTAVWSCGLAIYPAFS